MSIAIQHHPDRAMMVKKLAGRIGECEVVTDPDPLRGRVAWRTYREALERTPDWATHRLIIQDDVSVCREFAATIANAVAAQPDRVILFFVGGAPTMYARAVMAACGRDDVWAELDGRHWCPVVATCWPVRFTGPLVEFAQAGMMEGMADDEIAGRFLRSIDEKPIATVPSLVEHPDVVRSLVGLRASAGSNPGRVAACWIGDCDECDPSTIDWTGEIEPWWRVLPSGRR